MLHMKLPDEHGWYWTEDEDGVWKMAFVNTRDERVTFYSDDDNSLYEECMDFDDFDAGNGLIVRWFGPFACPGGPFGEVTVEKSVEHYEQAKKEKKAMVIVHVDFRFCPGPGKRYGSNITSSSVLSDKDAAKYIDRETDAFKAEAKKAAKRKVAGSKRAK